VVTTEVDQLEQQQVLQGQAVEVQQDLHLPQRLSVVGAPVRVGSAALGVMVRRALDFTVICADLGTAVQEAVAGLGAGLSLHPRVRQVQLRNDTGAWNTDPTYPDGLYLGLQYRSQQDQDWTLDLWFVDQPDRQPDLAHLQDLLPALTPTRRATILAIKQACCSLPEHRSKASSYDVYRAVLEHDVRTTEQFDQWLHNQR